MTTNIVETTSCHRKEQKTVEERLKELSIKLADAEANIELFSRMHKGCIATNDVYHFTYKQLANRKSSKVFDPKILKVLMKQKLNDACAHANKLRQAKNKLRRTLVKNYSNNPKEWRKILKRISKITIKRKQEKIRKNNIKFKRCKAKQEINKIKDSIPAEARPLLDRVNVFKGEVEPERLEGPMVCSKEMVLSGEEIEFLTKGPRFMLRPELDRMEYGIELEKMVAKQTYRNGDKVPELD